MLVLEPAFVRRGGVVVVDPAAAVRKFEEIYGDGFAGSVDVAKRLPRGDGDNLPGLDRVTDRVTKAPAGVGLIKPNGAVMFAARVKADEAHRRWRGWW